VVVNPKPGPTSKAQKSEPLIGFLHDFEKEHFCRFAAVTVHDSEDVVHPYESRLRIFGGPVRCSAISGVSTSKKPSWKNFFSEITSGTYADEFAENHYRHMVMRIAHRQSFLRRNRFCHIEKSV